jgi:hypothetical protein
MSTSRGDALTGVLRQVGQGLSLPLPHRVRILRELAADLESFTALLVKQGMPTEEAHRRATEALVPDEAALRLLDCLHEPWYRRRTGHVLPDRLRMMERGALAVSTALVLGAEAYALRQVDVFGDPSPFLGPVLAMGALLFALVASKAFQLFIKGDDGSPRAGLLSILSCSGATLGLGLGGTVFDLYRLAGTLEANPEVAAALVPLWLGRSAVLLTVALITSMAGALGWFILNQWVSVSEGAQREVLGLPPRSPLSWSDHDERIVD